MKRFATSFIIVLCLLLSACGLYATPPTTETTAPTIPDGSTFEVHYIDVGQADAALVICDGKAMLIDGGNAADSDLIYTYLLEQKVSHLEYMVATHAHEDHVGGLSGALHAVSVGTTFCSVDEYNTKTFRIFKEQVAKTGGTITVPEPGYTFNLGSAICTILGPLSPAEDHNNDSIVLRIVYGSTGFLFAGDAEYEEETDILDSGADVRCTVLKVGHHGSGSSTGYRWLRAAQPAYAVISVGAGNQYDHPHESALSRLRDADVTVYRTDLHGDIICKSDGKTVVFTTQRGGGKSG